MVTTIATSHFVDKLYEMTPPKPAFMRWLDDQTARRRWAAVQLERLLIMSDDDEAELRRRLLARRLRIQV